MEGKITFKNAEDLGEFLKAFTGSSALFNVTSKGDEEYVLEFTGGF